MSDDIPNLRGGHLTTIAFIVGPLLGAVMVLAGIIWQAAKYPERSEFNSVRDDVIATKQSTALHQFRLDGIQIRVDAIDVKLDRLLEEGRKGRGR